MGSVDERSRPHTALAGRSGGPLLVNDVTGILRAIEKGDPQAAERLWPLVYDELRRLAGAQAARQGPGQTLGATALVHEAYLRLAGGRDKAFANRRSLANNGGPPAPTPFRPAARPSTQRKIDHQLTRALKRPAKYCRQASTLESRLWSVSPG